VIYYFLIPFCIQFLAIFFDEFYFHRQRGLPLWEKIGHPLDTLTVFAALSFACYFPFSIQNLKIYLALCIISLFMITKDEFIHKDICPKLEMWLHALLFINHPLILLSAGIMWGVSHEIYLFDSLKILSGFQDKMLFFLKGQALFSLLFCFYQIIYWNFIYKPKGYQNL
jgi:hypothetical protein